MAHVLLGSTWAHDLPVCFPGRACVDVPPLGADVIDLTTALTPVSPGLAAAAWAVLGAALVLIGPALRRQWRGSRVRPWLVVLPTALLVGGFSGARAVAAHLGEVELIFSGADGRPSAPPPMSLVGTWPLVLWSLYAAMGIGALALFLMLNTVVVHRGRAARGASGAD